MLIHGSKETQQQATLEEFKAHLRRGNHTKARAIEKIALRENFLTIDDLFNARVEVQRGR